MRLPVIIAGVIVVSFSIVITVGLLVHGPDLQAELRKRECTDQIIQAVRESQTREEAEAILRAKPLPPAVCSGFELNGFPVIQ
jgi:hypothetical protein